MIQAAALSLLLTFAAPAALPPAPPAPLQPSDEDCAI